MQIQYSVNGTNYVRTPQVRQDSEHTKGFGAGLKQADLNSSPKDFAQSQNSQNAPKEAPNDVAQSSQAAQTAQTKIKEANEAQKAEGVKKEKIEELEGHKNRITYGLKVLELMSDEEYRAFLWASEGMSDSEKMLMAQSLYRFTSFYQGKQGRQHEVLDTQTLDAQKAFGVESSMTRDFINRYKNAYERVLSAQGIAP